jgi:hypothetical protein
MKDSTIRLSQGLQGLATVIDQSIEQIAGERVAFTLLVFTEGRASYVSTANREESVREIKTLLSHWEQGMPDVPAHKVM